MHEEHQGRMKHMHMTPEAVYSYMKTSSNVRNVRGGSIHTNEMYSEVRALPPVCCDVKCASAVDVAVLQFLPAVVAEKLKRLDNDLDMLDEVVEFALSSGADIMDVDGDNEPIFTEQAKRQWLKDVTDDLRKAISNPYEKAHLDPKFSVRAQLVWHATPSPRARLATMPAYCCVDAHMCVCVCVCVCVGVRL